MKNIRTAAQLLFLALVRPLFPAGQWVVLKLGLYKGPKTVEGPHNRQPYLIGTLKDGITKEEVRSQLSKNGFFMNRIALFDSGQVLSMRRLDETKPDMQYHVRIFSDGEVRGHYEYTPQDKPWKHLSEEGREVRREMFQKWFEGLLR